MENFSAGTLKLEVKESALPHPIQLLWSGRSTDRDPGKLFGHYLSEVIALAAARSVPVEMHFEHLEYFNSSTISAILKTIHEAKQRKVKLILAFDAALKWQAVNFASMRHLFPGDELVELRPVGPLLK
jgi:hypothetical protein